MPNGNFYSDATGYNANQLNILTGTMGASVVLAGQATGSYTVTNADVTATKSIIVTNLATVHGFLVQIYRAGAGQGLPTVTVVSNDLNIATNGTVYTLTAGDIINYFAY